MFKVEAIKRVMLDYGGAASLSIIYDNIAKYYPRAKEPDSWQAGLRGVLYRATGDGQLFKKIGLGIYALQDYQETMPPDKKDNIRMHSYIEGICLELGNVKKFLTYTADTSAVFKGDIKLGDLASIKELPKFTYPEITSEAKRIDVIWLNASGLQFPQKVFEVVDSLSTLTNAFNRSLQLLNFRTKYYIVAPQQHKKQFDKKIQLAPYNDNASKFKFINYDQIIDLYENAVKTNEIESSIF